VGCGTWRARSSASPTPCSRIFDANVDIGFYVVLIFLVIAGATNG
jgi:hypothetical protein